jgi:hypothetical protein
MAVQQFLPEMLAGPDRQLLRIFSEQLDEQLFGIQRADAQALHHFEDRAFARAAAARNAYLKGAAFPLSH